MERRVFLIHGFRGTPEIPKWYPWLKKELEDCGYEVKSPQFPSPEMPKLKEWDATFEKELDGNFSDVIFVGHSLGGIAAIRAIENHQTDEMAKAVILVGAPIKEATRPEIREFLPPIDWNKVKSKVSNFIYVYSDDDPYVPIEHGLEFNKVLPGRFIPMSDYLHFQAQNSLPEILKIIKELG